MRIVLLGPPGSGKGTQGLSLADRYGIPHIASGDMIRDQIARRTDFGRKIEAAVSAGDFAPDDEIIKFVTGRLAEPDALDGFILDGFPRDTYQAVVLDDWLHSRGTPLSAVIELKIGDEELVERLSGRLICPTCGESYHLINRPPVVQGQCDHDGHALVRRPDDEPAAIRHRFEIYEGLTLPLREYYAGKGLLRSTEAGGQADGTLARIIAQLT